VRPRQGPFPGRLGGLAGSAYDPASPKILHRRPAPGEMTLSYRAMRIDDLAATLAVRLSTVENTVTPEDLERDYGVTPASVAEAMRSHVKGWLCEESAAVIGFAMGDGSTGEMLVVAVRPEHEGRGIGGILLARVEAWLFAQGHEEIWLLANPDPQVRASGFYRKLGWQATGTMRNGDEVMTLRKADAAPGGRK